MLTVKKQQCCNPEVWGGIECTINRVGDKYYDQLFYAGHYQRDNDLDQIADLGIKSLRYPVLWEFHENNEDGFTDWSWTEARLCQLQQLKIDPIVTLLHHGSGPLHTDLLDDEFPIKLAAFAGKVAEKFPWINNYTPVNEPLTTARFSGLYGFWYPHKTNDVSFIKMLINELKGVVLSMQAIRKINPGAKLIQTEDLGKTYSKPSLSYQADFENHRRWLSYDLLSGKVDANHPMMHYFSRLGIPLSDTQFFLDNPCPPDILGLNYYVTSERYLDDDTDKYPNYMHGSNDLQTYADVEAMRVPLEQEMGLQILMREAWDRYSIPLAITEAHLNCGREEQLRWLKEKWEDCCKISEMGIPVLGFTIWSLLGAFGWNKLLLTEEKDYEIGAFDVRSGEARPTAIAHFIKQLTTERVDHHPVTSIPGWWKRNIRFFNGFQVKNNPIKENIIKAAPVLIIGKNGTLGKAFAAACAFRKINYVLVGRNEIDITRTDLIEKAILMYKPWGIINASGYVRVDEAEGDVKRCMNENAYGVQNLAECCRNAAIQLISFSSDLVFDGNSDKPYVESDRVNPLNIYGKSKVLAEDYLTNEYPDALMVRTSTFYSPEDNYNFVYDIIDKLTNGKNYTAPNDIYISPTYVPDLVNTCIDLFIDNEKGIWHLTSGQKWSWSDLAEKIADEANLNKLLITSCPSKEISFKAKRPCYSVLGTNRGIILPGFEDGLKRYLNAVRTEQRKLNLKI